MINGSKPPSTPMNQKATAKTESQRSTNRVANLKDNQERHDAGREDHIAQQETGSYSTHWSCNYDLDRPVYHCACHDLIG